MVPHFDDVASDWSWPVCSESVSVANELMQLNCCS